MYYRQLHYLTYSPYHTVISPTYPSIIPMSAQSQRMPYSFPPVNVRKFNTSAKRFQLLMKQAIQLIDKIAESDQFARELMEAAQSSNENKVKQLITSGGITVDHDVKYTPSGIVINLRNVDIAAECCMLSISLRW